MLKGTLAFGGANESGNSVSASMSKGFADGMSGIDWQQIRKQQMGDFTLRELPPNIKLPALPHAVPLFVKKSNDPSARLAELAAIVETDTGLTLEILRYVNSAYLGLRHKVKSAHQAIALLGLRQSKMFLISTGMKAAVEARRSKLINQSCFWNASLQKALVAKEVARLLRTDSELSFAGALLQDYLLPVITNELTDAYLNFVATRDEQPQWMWTYPRSQFGWYHALAAACLALRGSLPDDLVCCLLLHHRGLPILEDAWLRRSPVAAGAMSALLPDQLRKDHSGRVQLHKPEEQWPAFYLAELTPRLEEEHERPGWGVHNAFRPSRRSRPALKLDEAYRDGTLNHAAVL